MSESIPLKLRDAGVRYSTDRNNDDVGRLLFSAFEIVNLGDQAHRRAAWLCVLAVRRVLDAWTAFKCEGRAPEASVEAVARWAVGGHAPVDWLPLCKVPPAVRQGRLVEDCDADRLQPIALAAGHTADFARTGDPAAGDEALSCVGWAVFHGIHAEGAMPFEKWIAEVALPAAWTLRDLSDAELFA